MHTCRVVVSWPRPTPTPPHAPHTCRVMRRWLSSSSSITNFSDAASFRERMYSLRGMSLLGMGGGVGWGVGVGGRGGESSTGRR